MLSLPLIKGKYPIGATDFTIPLNSTSHIGKAKVKDGNTLRPALVLEEVAFTAFYPTDTRTGKYKYLDWLVRPVRTMLQGYAHFAGLSKIYTWIFWPIMYLYGSRITIPVSTNAPLLSSKDQWPLVIFSHGLGGTRTSYSHICARLAAEGRVVLAMEHRDGTGPTCVWGARRQERKLFYIQEDAVIWDGEEGEGTMPLRTDQLEMRRREIYLVYDAIKGLVNRDYDSLHKLKNRGNIDLSSWMSSDVPRVKVDKDVTLAGHSFGGATVLSILSKPPPEHHLRIPTSHALALDPWLEPLATPGPTPFPIAGRAPGPSEPSLLTLSSSTDVDQSVEVDNAVVHAQLKPRDGSRQPRMLVLNSEGFTLWKDHFERLCGVVEAWEPEGRRVLTLLRAEHISFSDFPLLPLIRRANATTLMDLIVRFSLAFLDGHLDETMQEMGRKVRKMQIEEVGKGKNGRPKKILVGEVGDIVVH